MKPDAALRTSRRQRTAELMWPRLFRRFEGRSATLQGQLRDMLVHALMEGYLSPGEALPSSRELAQSLALSRTTVTLALKALADKGMIEARSRSGYFVGPQLQSTYLGARQRARAPSAGSSVRWQERLQLHPSAQRNISKPVDWQKQPYPFIYGQFDASLFPNADWRECVLESMQARSLRRWAPDHIDRDDDTLVDQIQRRLLPARGIWAGRDEILVTSGAQQATYLLSTLLVGPSTQVGMEDPGYPDARNNFTLRTAQVKPLPVDAEGLVLDEAMTSCHYVYVTPSHQCPTTVTMPLARRQALLARAERDDFVVIEDDHESELNFSGQPTPALKSLDSQSRVVYIGSLSKTLAHGLRLGYVVAPAELISELRSLRRLVMRHVPTYNQQVAASFIAHGHQEAYVRRLNLAYQERAQVLQSAWAHHAPQVRAVAALGGSALWLDAGVGVDTRELASRLYTQGVVVEPGDVFFAGPQWPRHFMRVGYSSIAADRIEAGVKLIAAEIRSLQRISPKPLSPRVPPPPAVPPARPAPRSALSTRACRRKRRRAAGV